MLDEQTELRLQGLWLTKLQPTYSRSHTTKSIDRKRRRRARESP